MSRWTLAVMGTIVLVLTIVGSARAAVPVCGVDVAPALFISAPKSLVEGTSGQTDVSAFDDSESSVESASLTYEDQSGRVLFVHQFTAGEIQRMQEDYDDLYFPIETGAGTTAIMEQLSTVVEDDTTFPAQACVQSQDTTTTVSPAVQMGLRADRDAGEIFATAPHGNCKDVSPGSATIVIGYSGSTRASYKLASACSQWRRSRGPAPGVKAETDGSTLIFRASGAPNVRYRYTVTAQVAGEAPQRYALATEIVTTGGSRIYQGTDSFVNVCIDHSLTVYSSRGRLYCFIRGTRTPIVTLR